MIAGCQPRDKGNGRLHFQSYNAWFYTPRRSRTARIASGRLIRMPTRIAPRMAQRVRRWTRLCSNRKRCLTGCHVCRSAPLVAPANVSANVSANRIARIRGFGGSRPWLAGSAWLGRSGRIYPGLYEQLWHQSTFRVSKGLPSIHSSSDPSNQRYSKVDSAIASARHPSSVASSWP